MNGFNLPPGVSVHDIPGNRPYDLYFDRALELMVYDYDILTEEEVALAEMQIERAYERGETTEMAANLADYAVDQVRMAK